MKHIFGFDAIKDYSIPIANVNPYSESQSYGFLTYGAKKENYVIDTTFNLIKEDIPFMYLIDYRPGNEQEFFSSLNIPKNIIECALQNKCKIGIFAATEYASGRNITDRMNEFADEHNLNKDVFCFITGNLKIINKDTDRFSYISYNYFLDFPWFILKNERHDINRVIPYVLKKKILCYNRRPHIHRKILVYNIINNPLLLENTMLSYGGLSNLNINNIYHFQEKIKDESLQNEMFEFFLNNEFELNLDEDKMEYNLANNFNLNHHQQSFISLVSETNVDSDNLFFSEKTYKPIYAQQPFIIYGNPYSLKYLKEIGFKTFDKWIDESYDNEEDFEERLKKIIKVLENISLKSFEELNKIREEMQDVLIHNYKHFLTLDITDDFIKNLGFINKKRTKLI
jgi:hypothetical protein